MTTRRTFIASLVAIACGLFTRERPGMRWLKANGREPSHDQDGDLYWSEVEQMNWWVRNQLPPAVFRAFDNSTLLYGAHRFRTEHAAMEAAAIVVEKAGLA